MQKKKGFTLIELIVVIVLITILILITVFVFDIKGKIEPKKTSTLNEAVNTYYQLKYKNNTLNYSRVNDNIRYCVDFENLLSEGYIEESEIPLMPDGNPYPYALYENDTLVQNLTASEAQNICKVQKINLSDVLQGLSKIGDINNNEVDNFEFSEVITPVDAETYNVESNFKIRVTYQSLVQTYAPVYIIFVLDRSGSMDGTPIRNATKAIENLSKSLANLNNQNDGQLYCMSLVSFSNGYTKDASGSSKTKKYTYFYNADYEKNFSSSAFTNISTNAPGGTCYNEGMGVAYSVLTHKSSFVTSNTECQKHLNDEDALNVVLFLSDGEPFDDYGVNYSSCSYGDTIKNYTEKIKKEFNGKIFTISYNYTNNNHLKCIASNVDDTKDNYHLCNTYTNGSSLYGYMKYKDKLDTCNGKCSYYFESSTNEQQLANVFENFSNIVQNESKKSEYEKATIEFELSDYFTVLDNKNNCIGKDDSFICKDVDLANDEVIVDGIITDNLIFNVNLKNIDSITQDDILLFKNVSIIVHDNDSKVEDKKVTLKEEDLPKLNVYKYTDSLIN